MNQVQSSQLSDGACMVSSVYRIAQLTVITATYCCKQTG